MSSNQNSPDNYIDTGGSDGVHLDVSGLAFDYEGVTILSGVDLSIARGEFVGLVGPSGCGKSTLLNLIAGVLSPAAGQIRVSGVSRSSSRLGQVSHMQQKDLLLPWRTVASNAQLGLEVQGAEPRETATKIYHLARTFGISDVLDSMPWQLSGGMRQRASLLRAVLPDNRVLLLDEPFGALDAITRGSLQQWLLNVLDRSDKAVLLVTHDVEEAILLSDRVLVMAPNPGRIVAEIKVGLGDRRNSEASTSAEFVELKKQILRLLNCEQALT